MVNTQTDAELEPRMSMVCVEDSKETSFPGEVDACGVRGEMRLDFMGWSLMTDRPIALLV